MGPRTAWSTGLILIAACVACAQPPVAPAPAVTMAQNKWIVREIDDPNTGDHWLLVRNDQIPGGPGRLVLAAAHRKASGGAALPTARLSAGEAEFLPVIRTGDRLIVEEHTARVDAVLEARALNPAAPGAAFDVRLRIGGRVVRAVALGPGRAALHPEAEVRP